MKIYLKRNIKTVLIQPLLPYPQRICTLYFKRIRIVLQGIHCCIYGGADARTMCHAGNEHHTGNCGSPKPCNW